MYVHAGVSVFALVRMCMLVCVCVGGVCVYMPVSTHELQYACRGQRTTLDVGSSLPFPSTLFEMGSHLHPASGECHVSTSYPTGALGFQADGLLSPICLGL